MPTKLEKRGDNPYPINGWWCEEQAGFRKLRSTEDQVLRISQSISDGFQQKKPERSVMALVDYSKAYDTVWRWRLIQVMLDKGVPRRMVQWIAGFLRNRQARVKIDGNLGKRHRLKQGVPQGPVLSPILFLFFIDGVRAAIPRELEVSMYADDVAIWVRNRDKRKATEQVEQGCRAIAEWSRTAKLTINASKCEVGFFSTSTGEAEYQPHVEVNGTMLRVNPTPTFLGVVYDRSLYFKPHVDAVVDRVKRKSRMLAACANKNWGWRTKTMRQVFLACVRSIMDYCGPGWQPWLSNSQVERLERAQNAALGYVTGHLRTTPVEALRLESQISSYSTTTKRKALTAWEKSLRLPLEHPRRIIANQPIQHRLRIRSSWRHMSTELAARVFSADTIRQPLTAFNTAPWARARDLNWQVHTTLGDRNGRQPELEAMRREAIDTIRNRIINLNAAAAPNEDNNSNSTNEMDTIIIYTDGSASAGKADGGSAAVITSGDPGTSSPRLTSDHD